MYALPTKTRTQSCSRVNTLAISSRPGVAHLEVLVLVVFVLGGHIAPNAVLDENKVVGVVIVVGCGGEWVTLRAVDVAECLQVSDVHLGAGSSPEGKKDAWDKRLEGKQVRYQTEI